jgi:hypothetical protein
MTPDARFRINSLPFAHETIEGEVVIVNVEEGTYYSLRDTGAEVWTLLESGVSLGEVVGELVRRYQCEPAEIQVGVERLLADLQREGIVSAHSGEAMTDSRPTLPRFATSDLGFTRPILERFTDMKDLLLLDPIHEGGDTGWPIVKHPEP